MTVIQQRTIGPKSRRTCLYSALFLVAGAHFACPLRVGIVVGHSMAPSFRNGTPYILDRGYYRRHPVRRGDVIVFDYEGATSMKRVIGVAGDTLHVLTSDGGEPDTLVMGWQLPSARRVADGDRFCVRLIQRRIPEGTCYVVGDHLNVSMDSREYGPIPLDQIRGKVLFAPEPQRQIREIAGRAAPPTPRG